MALAIIDPELTVSLETKLTSLGYQTDPYNDVLGGHKSLIDLSGLPSSLSGTDPVPNLIFGRSSGAMSGGWTADVSTDKGIKKPSGLYWVNLDDGFNLLNYGSEPSVVLSAWISYVSATDNVQALMGFADEGGHKSQWSFAVTTDNGHPQIRCNINALTADFDFPAANTPTLHTIYIKRTGSGTQTAYVYLGSTLVGTIAGSYPFNNPQQVVTDNKPAFGFLHGYNLSASLILHRANAFQVDPATFSVSDWIAAELANNAGRFV